MGWFLQFKAHSNTQRNPINLKRRYCHCLRTFSLYLIWIYTIMETFLLLRKNNIGAAMFEQVCFSHQTTMNGRCLSLFINISINFKIGHRTYLRVTKLFIYSLMLQQGSPYRNSVKIENIFGKVHEKQSISDRRFHLAFVLLLFLQLSSNSLR